MSEVDAPPGVVVPDVGFSRLLLVVTGSITAAATPSWLAMLRTFCPDLETQVVVTRSAERFVTRDILTLHGAREVFRDEWPLDDPRARHVVWWDWADAIAIVPSTLHFMGRLALGLGDSPALLAAQCAKVPVGLAPAVPPGGVESAAYASHWAALSARPNVALAPPQPGGKSATTGRDESWTPAPLPDVLELMERRRVELLGAQRQVASAAAMLADRGSK